MFNNLSIWKLLWELLLVCIVCLLVLDRILICLKIPSRLRRSYELQWVLIWCGVSLAIIWSVQRSKGDLDQSAVETWHLLPDGVAVLKSGEDNTSRLSPHQRFGTKTVIFISTTDYSTVQSALLTRTGQALFRVRRSVLWIVVSLPLATGEAAEQLVFGENDTSNGTTFGELIRNREDLIELHLGSLERVIARFGVPYVVLSSHKDVEFSWKGFHWSNTTSRDVRGYQVGLLWALKNLRDGVIMMGDGDFAYNFQIFEEVKNTKIASCWAVGFGPHGTPATIPLVKQEDESDKPVLIGYHDGKSVRNGSLPLEIGSFALNLAYLRNSVTYSQYWKLGFTGVFLNDEFQIPVTNFRTLGRGGSEIYVWRTVTDTGPWQWPDSVVVKKDHVVGSNLKALLKNVFGPRFYTKDYFQVQNTSQPGTDYLEYGFENHIKPFIR